MFIRDYRLFCLSSPLSLSFPLGVSPWLFVMMIENEQTRKEKERKEKSGSTKLLKGWISNALIPCEIGTD